MRKTLVINAGSSSIKYKLFNMPEYEAVAEGMVDRIGLKVGEVNLKFNGDKFVKELEIPNHEVGIKQMLELLEENKVIENYDEITKIGHRAVQGGEKITSSVLVGDEELAIIKEYANLAPLHNIPNAVGIEVFSKLMPNAQNIAVFDTAFHQTMPEESYIYPVPYSWYKDHGVRRYGMHGTSHHYISDQIEERYGKDYKLINCHLGNGASLCAVDSGKVIQTSMGLTPLAGIMMGTRSGDIDPSIIEYMSHETGMTLTEITSRLNKDSGMLGLSGISSDFRDIGDAIKEGNPQAKLAMDVYVTRIVETIGSYYVRLGGLDALVFTAGIGENDLTVRKAVCEKLAVIGIKLDDNANETRGTELISAADSKVPVLVIPTEEEYQIAKEAEKF
ncbi:MAG: acetate/propionate family kinase [Mycoplasmatales bacterium]